MPKSPKSESAAFTYHGGRGRTEPQMRVPALGSALALPNAKGWAVFRDGLTVAEAVAIFSNYLAESLADVPTARMPHAKALRRKEEEANRR